MKRILRNLYLSQRFFRVLFTLTVLFIISYFIPSLLQPTKILFFVFLIVFLIDWILVFSGKTGVIAKRIVPDKLSNGDDNKIFIKVRNRFRFKIHLRIIDELPVQWQIRDFGIQATLDSNEEKRFSYTVRPVERGVYQFGNINLFSSSIINLAIRRQRIPQETAVPNYPSFLQLKKYDFIAFSNRLSFYGLKKIRRLGQTMEFEQIKEYIPGDDVRNINWKATAKRNELMVNQYQDQRSQPVYCIIDKGRVMQMPFNEMSLLDYAVNASLVMSNIVLKKQDKAGIFTFSRRIEDRVKAERRNMQMQLILEALYNIETDFAESDFARLYIDIKHTIKQRSLLLLFTNFETLDALHRQLPYLQALNKTHLLVVIFFENSELKKFAEQKAENTIEAFEKTIAEKFLYEKKLIVNELLKHGIQSILTEPQNLTVNTINKYLEIKARGF